IPNQRRRNGITQNSSEPRGFSNPPCGCQHAVVLFLSSPQKSQNSHILSMINFASMESYVIRVTQQGKGKGVAIADPRV
ncbi:hypothetical protein, partial [Gluconacetobacter entanii]|uniref:hypothetical protein n=1 Tax=Gluconacetobacter entanii TaxID=108528 RepID=UPI00223686C7